MRLGDTFRRAASLLVEMPAEETKVDVEATPSASAELNELLADLSGKIPTARTVDQIVRASDGPNLDEIRSSGAAPVVAPDGTADFNEVYRQANLPAAPFTAEAMLAMLAELPSDLPLDTKRQTVKVTLGALGKSTGATADSIVADASRKLAALAACVENLSNETAAFIATTDAEIAALQAQVEQKRKAIQSAKQTVTQVTQACDGESDRLDDVLEFFSLDVPPSRYAAGSPPK